MQLLELGSLVSCLPLDLAEGVFAYGSGALPQLKAGQASTSGNMADFIVIVPDAAAFHEANLQANPGHYSAIRLLGAERLGKYQRRLGARVYFNTLCPTSSGRLMKYGIVEMKDLERDLLDWDHLYLAGRLHKPIAWIRSPSHVFKSGSLSRSPSLILGLRIRPRGIWCRRRILGLISSAQTTNLKSALHVSLVLLPEEFTLTDLFTTITSLSYAGDFRSLVGEDRNKISNIVAANMDRFELLYGKLLRDSIQIDVQGQKTQIYQDHSTRTLFYHLELFPREVLWRIQDSSPKLAHMDLEEMMFDMAHSVELGSVVSQSINSIVRSSSIRQTLKNIPTAGFAKSARYALSKLTKMMRSLRR